MLMYRCVERDLQLWEEGTVTHLNLPAPPANPLHAGLSRDGRYVSFANDRGIPAGSPAETALPKGAHGLWVYDRKERGFFTVPHQVQPSDVFWDICFGADGVVYFSDGNTFWRWRPGAERTEKLLRFQRTKGAPMGLDVSPEGSFLSYYKFRSGSQMLHLYDLETEVVRDLKCSIYRCCWADEGRIAWTKSAGLKLLDVGTGKSKTVLRGFQDILKRDSGYAGLLEPFVNGEVWQKLHLLGHRHGRLWFVLWLQASCQQSRGSLYRLSSCLPGKSPPTHTGVWSVAPDGSCPRLQFSLPKKTPDLHALRLLPDGGVGGETCSAQDQVTAYVWAGTDFQPFPGWRLVPGALP